MNWKAFAVISFAAANGMLLGCKTTKPAANANTTPLANTTEVPATKTVPEWVPKPAPYHAAETQLTDLVHTKLRVSFDWQKQHLLGEATLTCKPYFYPQNRLVLDAKGFDIKSIALASGKELKYTYDQKKLTINLDRTYIRNEKYEVIINYVAKPNELEAGGSAAITSDKGLYFINPLGEDKTKPRQIWTQGETQASSCWFPTIDAPNQKMTQEIYITIEKNFKTLSNGTLVYSKNNANGTRTDYWKQEQPHAPYLVMMAIGEYAVVHDTWKNKDVDYYVEPKYKNHARAIFGNTPEMLSFYSQKLGVEFPWDKYAQVVARDYVSGAMENTSATLHGEFLQQTRRELLDKNNEDVIAHELFHQWFGDLVTAESWSNLPLNESFATYGEYIWNEYKYGRDVADLGLTDDLNNYLREARRKQVPLIRYHYQNQEDMFDRHSYQKGGRVLHMLRNYVGDDAFFAALKKYLSDNKYKSAEVAQLRLAFEEVTGEDLMWFFNQWFLQPGHPELKVEPAYENGKLTVRVQQLQDTLYTPVYKLPLKLAVWSGGNKTEYPVTVSRTQNAFEFPLASKPDLVLFDSDAQLLGTIQQEKSTDELIYQFKNASHYFHRSQALAALMKQVTEPKVTEVFQSALKEKFWMYRNVAVSAFNATRFTNASTKDGGEAVQFSGPEFAPVKEAIKQIALADPKTMVRADAITALSSYRDAAYIPVFTKALSDSSYLVIAAGIDALVSVDKAEQYLPQIKALENSGNANVATSIASFYAKNGNGSEYAWFEKQINQLPPNGLTNFLQVFGAYLYKVPEQDKLKGIALLEKVASENAAISARLGAYMALTLLTDEPGVKEKLEKIKANEKDERLKLLFSESSRQGN